MKSTRFNFKTKKGSRYFLFIKKTILVTEVNYG